VGVDANLGRASVAIRATLDKLDGDLSRAHGTVGSAMGKMTRLAGKGFALMGTAAVAGIGVATAATAGLAATLGKLAIDAAPVEGIASAFDGLAESAGYGSDKMLKALQRGSAGMVSQRDLMLSFNKAAQLVSTDFATQLPEAMGYLSKVSASTGQNMDYLMNSLVTGIGRVSPMILDNLGIQVSLADATKRAAQMYGVQEDALTKAQQQAGLMAVVMERLEANTAAMPDTTETAAAKMAQLRARVQDVKDEIGLAFLPTLNVLLGVVGDLSDRFLPPLLGIIEELGPKIAAGAEAVAEFVGALLDGESPIEAFKDLLGAIFPAIADMDWLQLGRDVLAWIGEGVGSGAKLAWGWANDNIVSPIVSFITETDWKQVAIDVLTKIGEGLATGYETVKGWVSEHIVTPMVSFVTETDWGEVATGILTKIGEGLAMGYETVRTWVVDHIVTPISTFITETDWSTVGQSILAKLGEIWEGIGTWVSEKLGGLLGTLTGGGEAPAEGGGGGLLGILDKITGFVNGPGGTVLSVLGAVVGILTGIGAPIGIAIGAIKLLSMAWSSNFGGIQEFTAGFAESVKGWFADIGASMQPFFDRLEGAWTWIKETAIPVLQRWGRAFARGIQPHLERMQEALADFQENLGPKLQRIWDKLSEVWDRISKVVMEKLWPAFQDLLEALGLTDESVEGAFGSFGDLIGQFLEYELDGLIILISAALDGLVLALDLCSKVIEGWILLLTEIFNVATDVIEVIEDVAEKVKEFAGAIEEVTGLELPDWLKPGSPPPLYYALRDIGKAMDALSGKELPDFGGMGPDAANGGAGGNSSGVTLYGPVILEDVQDGRGFLESLQALAV
jgi:hypothetical protein